MHGFQFETRGARRCVALQTHINDVMTKRHKEEAARGTEGRARKKWKWGHGGGALRRAARLTARRTRGRPDQGGEPPPRRLRRLGGSDSSSSPETENAKRVLAANRKIEAMAQERAALRERLDKMALEAARTPRGTASVARLEAELEAARESGGGCGRATRAEADGEPRGETDDAKVEIFRRVGELTVARDAGRSACATPSGGARA